MVIGTKIDRDSEYWGLKYMADCFQGFKEKYGQEAWDHVMHAFEAGYHTGAHNIMANIKALFKDLDELPKGIMGQ